jgi:putative transposase
MGRGEVRSQEHGQTRLSVPQRKTIRHFNGPDHIHFLTFSCYRQLPFFKSDRTKEWLVEAIAKAIEKHKFALFAYVIMPEHAHLLIQPQALD